MVVESRSVIRNAKNSRGWGKSCASYFRFARFNTFPLYYLRAWHRLRIGRQDSQDDSHDDLQDDLQEDLQEDTKDDSAVKWKLVILKRNDLHILKLRNVSLNKQCYNLLLSIAFAKLRFVE